MPHELGLGLRPSHYNDILSSRPSIDFFECITEDFIHCAGDDFDILQKIRADYPVSLHGVSLSIGSVDPLNTQYLVSLKKLVQQIHPIMISDHFCWTGVNQINTHDLLPLPYTREAADHLVSRIHYVQDFLGRQIMLENVSSYVDLRFSEMTESEFIADVSKRAECFILLDINNVFVNAFNHGFCAKQYLQTIPVERVKQFHLAGHKHCQTHIIDTHDADIDEAVWQLFFDARDHFGKIPVVIERDANIPPLSVLLNEIDRVRACYAP